MTGVGVCGADGWTLVVKRIESNIFCSSSLQIEIDADDTITITSEFVFKLHRDYLNLL